MKTWTATQNESNNPLKDIAMIDLFKSEILDTRLVVSEIFAQAHVSVIDFARHNNVEGKDENSDSCEAIFITKQG